MKLKIFPTIISVCITVLLTYLLNVVCKDQSLLWIITFGGGITLFIPILVLLGLYIDEPRINANIKVLSAIFVLVITVNDFLFAHLCHKHSSFIVVTGLIILIYLLLLYHIAKTKEHLR